MTIAVAIKACGIMVSIGRGDGRWSDHVPETPASATGLIAPFAMLRPSAVQFVEPDNAGTLEVDGMRWAVSGTPTRYLHVECVLDGAEVSGMVIREYAIHLAAMPGGDVSPDENFIVWDRLTETGDVLAINRFPPVELGRVRVKLGGVLVF